MSVFSFVRTREWVVTRRLALVGLVLFLAYRNWGSSLIGFLRSADPSHDIIITKSEFRTDLSGSKPAWIIGVRNNSRRYSYDHIEIETTYFDKGGAILQTDMMTLKEKLAPGQEEVIGGTDTRERPGAVDGKLKIIKAEPLK